MESLSQRPASGLYFSGHAPCAALSPFCCWSGTQRYPSLLVKWLLGRGATPKVGRRTRFFPAWALATLLNLETKAAAGTACPLAAVRSFGLCVVRLGWIRRSLLSFPVLDPRGIQLRPSRAKASPPFRKAAAQIVPDFFSQLCFGLDDFSGILTKRLDTHSEAVPKLAVSISDCVQFVALPISLPVNSASSVLFHRAQNGLSALTSAGSAKLHVICVLMPKSIGRRMSGK